jgi:hypothetical protein
MMTLVTMISPHALRTKLLVRSHMWNQIALKVGRRVGREFHHERATALFP